MVACALDDGDGSRVAHTETFAYLTVDIEFARSSTVQSSVTCNDVLLSLEVVAPAGRWQNRDAPARKALAEVVVGLTLETDVEAAHGKGTEALASRALEFNLNRAVGKTLFAVFLGNHAREHRAHGAVSILDGIVECHLLLTVDCLLGGSYDFLVLHTNHLGECTAVPVQGFFAFRLVQQTDEVDSLLLVGSVGSVNLDELRMTDNLLQALYADFTEVFTHLLGEEGKEVHYVLRSSLEVFAQLWVLCRHTHRAGIRVTFAHHHTTQHNQRQRTKRELVGTKHRHDNHVLRGLQLTVGLQAHLVSQAVHHQRLLGFGQSDLGRDTREAHA